MGKLIGPSNPEDDGHIIGEYYGRELSKEEIVNYMYAEETDVKTGFMIFFQGLAINAWDSDKGCYTCMTALINDCLDASLYNSEWVKEKVRGTPRIIVHASKDISPNEEAFIEYGSLSFCRTSLPLSLLFKAVTHYWNQIMSTPADRECWTRIPQARTLFNSPYHTCKPKQKELILKRTILHHTTCSDTTCTCGLLQLYDKVAKVPLTVPKRKKARTTRKPRKASPMTTIASGNGQGPKVPIPNVTNYYYD